MRFPPLMVGLALVIAGFATTGSSVRAATPEPPDSSQRVIDLCGRVVAPAGWGTTCPMVMNPGPTIVVQEFEALEFHLLAGDGPTLSHRWILDVDNSGGWTPGEPQSGAFNDTTVPMIFAYTVNVAAGVYTYLCQFHPGAMRGLFDVQGATTPTISLTNPDGMILNRWSGNSVHRLSWTMSDPDGLPSQLSVYLNYSYNGGANTGTIVGPPTLPLGATNWDWTVPLIDATDVHVHADVIDPNFESGSDDRQVPVIDSTRPLVTGTLPGPGESGVDPSTTLEVTFSEGMDQPATEGALTLCRMPGCVPVALTVLGWNGNTLRTQPTLPLLANTGYQATVDATARDESDPGNTMAAPHVWSFVTTNDPPTLSFTQPSVGARWTGGSAHAITWTASDAEDPASALSLWLNYSAIGTAPWSAVAGPLPGDASSFLWMVPTDDTTAARVNATVIDTGGASTSVLTLVFTVDSSPPMVTLSNPGQGATGVPLGANMIITFSEPMNAAATEDPSVVALLEVASASWVPLVPLWGSADELTANPVPTLTPSTHYRLFVNGTAKDDADPGLLLSVAYRADFNTSTTPDVTPPSVTSVAALPESQVSGGAVNITATVTDDEGLAEVVVDVTQPDASHVNTTMFLASGNQWFVNRSWAQVGSHSFTVWASDTSGNWGSAAGSFAIIAPGDTTPPEIVHTPPAGPFRAESGGTILIEATVTDGGSGVQTVRLAFTDVDGLSHNVTMTDAGTGRFQSAIPMPSRAGSITYFIYAADAAGNENRSASVTLSVSPASPAADLTPILLAVVLLLFAAVGATVAIILRRKQKRRGPGGP